MTIPSVIVNTNQQEFKTGLRKAVSVLNSAITMNKALTGESPYDNGDLFHYLQQNMSVMRSTYRYSWGPYEGGNLSFYTADGMRYDIITKSVNDLSATTVYKNNVQVGTRSRWDFRLYENPDLKVHTGFENTYISPDAKAKNVHCLSDACKCGSLGLAHNPDSTDATPCIISVDVNGDRKPSPTSIYETERGGSWSYDFSGFQDPNAKLLRDTFSIMITDQGAIPYGVVAQKAMYQAQK